MTTLAWRRTGSPTSTPLLLLHAMPLDSSMWEGVRAALPGCDILTVDAPGFGASPTGEAIEESTKQRGLLAYSHAIARLLDELAISDVNLGGISMGGATAATFTLAFPTRVRALALMDTNIAADTATARTRRAEAIALCEAGRPYEAVASWSTTMLSPQVDESVRESIDARLRTVRPQSLAWMQSAMAGRADARAAVESSRPLFLLRGADDPTCPRKMLEELRMRATGPTTLVEIPKAGHFSAQENPRAVAEAIEEWLSGTLA